MASPLSTKMIQVTACNIELPMQDDVGDVLVGLVRMAYASVFRAPFALIGACFHLVKFGKLTSIYLINRSIQDWNRAKNELPLVVQEICHFVLCHLSYFLAVEIISFSLAPIPFMTCLVALGACQWSNFQTITDKAQIEACKREGFSGLFAI